MNILALDIATATGWARGLSASIPELGTFSIKKYANPPGQGFALYRIWLNKMLDQHSFDVVAFEAPILRAQTTISTTRRLQGLAAITEMVCHERGVKCVEEHLQTIKKTLTGNGRAKKPEMIRAAKARGMSPRNDNEADAFGLWLRVVQVVEPKQLSRFDPINFREAV